MRQVPTSFRACPRCIPAVAVLASLLCLRCSEPDNTDACPDDGKQILLTSPKGGESFRVGDSLRVKWKLCNAGVSEIDAVDPILSPDSGKTWCFMKVNSIPRGDKTFGNYAWKIPDSIQFQGQWFPLKNNSKCRVKVEQYSPLSDSQVSIGNVFTIK
jgi:hypothetical protein